jgi:glutamyl endopeptidase
MIPSRKSRWLVIMLCFATTASQAWYTPSGQAQRKKLSYPDTELPRNSPKARLSRDLQNVPPVEQPPVHNPTRKNSSGASRVVSQRLQPGKSQRSSQNTIKVKTVTPLQKLRSHNKEKQRQNRTVIGVDNRTAIADTTLSPFRSITKLIMTFPTGKYSCSGAIIAAKYVLTAGHCVYGANNGGWATQIEVIPGLNNSYKPYASAFATNMRTYSSWTQNGNSNYDIALITLDREIGNTTGWFNYAAAASVDQIRSTITGYPADRSQGLVEYTHTDQIKSSTQTRLSYPIDTAGGQSGSPVYDASPTIFGVHTNGSANGTANSGVRIDAAKYQDIQNWINSGT